MLPILLIKTGDTYPEIKSVHGDFESMIAACVPESGPEIVVYDAREASDLPVLSDYIGVIITGSHSMVTEKEPWSEHLLPFIRQMFQVEIPVFGICYGHQLISKAMGGSVAYHKQGIQAGTVAIALTDEAQYDPIFSQLPRTFSGNVGHSQSVIELPEVATLLASNHHESHEAIRLGKVMWGVQFHPEFTQSITRQYIGLSQAAIGATDQNVETLISECGETPESRSLIERFVNFAISRAL
ncbi:glutamine amidotransferase [Leucothrix pacifica]|uniref:Glutamine amidotransferase n=1 Tax=Leucothrix pacifica TaxID=1247513 RepID=A0A317CBA4_9GAMM|nr:glutamine amidotransferase [Leucothrix pacifica]PWQ95637.1 glutamine amidotransferase [Leucothrix pacifica]